MSFDTNRHPEEFEQDYLEYMKYIEEVEELNNTFTSGVKQLLDYKKVVDPLDYVAAVDEAYDCTDEDIKDFMTSFGIFSSSDFLIYLNGVVKGMSINE